MIKTKKQGNLIIISGTTCAGKGTVIRKVLEKIYSKEPKNLVLILLIKKLKKLKNQKKNSKRKKAVKYIKYIERNGK